jgi:hypothetical protein
MFKFRGFGGGGAEKNEPLPVAPANPPPVENSSSGSSLFGFRRVGEPAAAPAPPPMLAGGMPGNLPALPGERTQAGMRARADGPGATGMDQVLDRMGKGDRPTQTKKKQQETSTRRATAKQVDAKRPTRRGAQGASPMLWYLLGGLGFMVVAIVVGLVIALRPKSDGDPKNTLADSSGTKNATTATTTAGKDKDDTPSPTTRTNATAPTPAPTASNGKLDALLAKAHQGKETKELKAFVDAQAAMQARALETGKCEGSQAACSALLKTTDELGVKKALRDRPTSQGNAFRSKWMAGLKMPLNLPIEDNEKVQRYFQKYTDTPEGRASFESMLFRCGAYAEAIKAALITYEQPPGLLAVVYAESACYPKAKSPVGAEGLWQFMPEAARAYHLHVVDDVVDERHSPPKATEAAIHFLADLYAKFRSWDLVFAAYNMGPYGLATRMEQAGGENVGFWDLEDAELLPSETAEYVPIIEAFALILENLQHLKFSSQQTVRPEITKDLEAPGGTRLSLVARAASMSVSQLRLLNLDLDDKVDIVPKVAGATFAIQVPKDVAFQAHDTLQALIKEGSHDDQCVPPTFDWGKQRFTPEMEDECRKKQVPTKP